MSTWFREMLNISIQLRRKKSKLHWHWLLYINSLWNIEFACQIIQFVPVVTLFPRKDLTLKQFLCKHAGRLFSLSIVRCLAEQISIGKFEKKEKKTIASDFRHTNTPLHQWIVVVILSFSSFVSLVWRKALRLVSVCVMMLAFGDRCSLPKILLAEQTSIERFEKKKEKTKLQRPAQQYTNNPLHPRQQWKSTRVKQEWSFDWWLLLKVVVKYFVNKKDFWQVKKWIVS